MGEIIFSLPPGEAVMFNVDLQYVVYTLKKTQNPNWNNIENYQIPLVVILRNALQQYLRGIRLLFCAGPTDTIGPIKLTLEHMGMFL